MRSGDQAGGVSHAGDALTLDGNAAAGALTEVFGVDMTESLLTCAQCGTCSALAEECAYTHGPGVTVRCRSCSSVLACVTSTPHGVWFTMTGIRSWRVPIAEQVRR